ncbi:hypothetical protein jhhlp_000981 [Lomentospora prolificans]|uniref:Uncharacterized protein n=1 Tax=Lomentospora prolificans TaxID=41688 RepID=A0A2N3NK06_9PEZI|nr:hypothetical protein jhhlp_000981 [Lomentospora prolificans]
MATTHLPVLTRDTYEDALPIVLIPPSDDPPAASSPRTAAASEAEIRLLRLKNRSPKPPAHAHPIPSMQGAFNESLVEATRNPSTAKPKLRQYDAKTRRERLIAQEKGEELHGMLWRYRPGQTQHELCKLMSQISFGMNLLLNGKANSDDQVVSIIQGHIDEIDEFLEVALEDFQQATTDLSERIEYLRLPLEHIEVFEKLLEDRDYRAELVQNNEVIEHILSRTSSMVEQYESDFVAGLRSTKHFISYLAEQRDSPRRREQPDIDDIYMAMKGNTDGWYNAFKDSQQQASKVKAISAELEAIVATIQSKAGEVSRRTWDKIERFSMPRVSGIRASQQSSPASSPPPSVMSTRSPASSNSVDETVTTLPSHVDTIRFNRLTISAKLGPALENPFEDAKFIGGREDPISEEPSIYEDDNPTVDHREEHNRDSESIDVKQAEGGTEVEDELEKQGTRAAPVEGPKEEANDEEDDAYSTLYILQPRTYTPRLPAPLPSPAVKEYKPPVTTEPLSPKSNDSFSPRTTIRGSVEQQPASTPGVPKRSSLRQRVSLKGNPPESIKIPPPMRSTPQLRPSPKPSPKPSSRPSNLPDSAYGSDNDLRQCTSTAILPEPSPPMLNHTVPSPLSDRQLYRPVKASPHSPLQQRPHTSYNAFPTPPGMSHSFQPGHTRNAPSRLGGASTLSKVTTVTYDSNTSQAGGGEKRLKKKKSAFGWLKKAFSLDEDEKATFEARKLTQERNLYYQDRSKKFLDGRRVRQPNQPGHQSPASTHQGSTYQGSTYQGSTQHPRSPYQHSAYQNSASQHSVYHNSTGYPSPGYR